MQGSRLKLEHLAERWQLSQESVHGLERLLETLATDPEAPTSVGDPLRAVDVHVADSLCGLGVVSLQRSTRIVDIGSGAGFPGLVLAVAMRPARFDLVEASRRKCAFLERVAARVGVENVNVVCQRAEEWAAGEGAGVYGAAVTRAVGLLATLVEYAAPLLRVGGVLVAWKGRRHPLEERGGASAAQALGMKPIAVEWVGPFAGSRNRHIYTYEKVSECPPGYPRRAGMAKKRPLST